MENRNLNKALEITAKLITGEVVGAKGGNAMLYEEYSHNAEVYEILTQIMQHLELHLYEYNDALHISAGSNNRVFGFTNEELKRAMGLRLNKELFLAYFMMYNMITEFYKDSSSASYLEYLRMEDVIKVMDAATERFIDHSMGIVMEEAEKDSFKALALTWDELPMVNKEDKSGNESRAARNSKTGFTKLVLNFMEVQNLFTESEGRYYPTDRFRAIAEHYFEENRGRLYELMSHANLEMNDKGDEQNATD